MKSIPTADMQEIVRCKDCAYRNTTDCALCVSTIEQNGVTQAFFNGSCYYDNFYCARGVK